MYLRCFLEPLISNFPSSYFDEIIEFKLLVGLILIAFKCHLTINLPCLFLIVRRVALQCGVLLWHFLVILTCDFSLKTVYFFHDLL